MGTKPNIYNIATKINSDIEPAFGLEGTFTNLITYLKKRHIFFSDFDYEQLLQLLFYVHFLNKGLSKEQIEGMIDGLKVVIIVKNMENKVILIASLVRVKVSLIVIVVVVQVKVIVIGVQVQVK